MNRNYIKTKLLRVIVVYLDHKSVSNNYVVLNEELCKLVHCKYRVIGHICRYVNIA